MIKTGSRLSIFPLPGALLLPRAYLPLHIFEPRYRALVSDSLARDRRVAMIQPIPGEERADRPDLFDIGCVGRIANVEALEDGRFNLILEGVSRFRVVRELEAGTAFRQIEASFDEFSEDEADPDPLPSPMRSEIEREARRFADARGLMIDWDGVERLDDESLVNGMAQAIPFDVVTKQALLEAADALARADLLVDFLRLGAGDGSQTLQ
ncbi:hypothetical protein FHS31_001660 [Sphingomonas vulcanisoli]|uniref:Lon N-terminal domain-containing protein n=1 Tax=Sphingomonas vulcanisoli TaxID=1658060 RepID=A0ABX0TW87_9SPHN|nr:LON peptidase substrate-binding domain-containing protein [Sphingomonas vulcanisoli]NIJ08050.1 hypothetical protein [Sphingomonas vulcanisoli]